MAFDLELAPKTPNQPPMAHFEPDALSQGEKESEWWPTEPTCVATGKPSAWPGTAEGTARRRACVRSPWLRHSSHHCTAERGSAGCRQGSIGYDTFGMNEIAS